MPQKVNPTLQQQIIKRRHHLPGWSVTALSVYLLTTLAATAGCASTSVTADGVYFPSPPAAPHAVHIRSFNRLHDLVKVRAGFLDAIRGRIASPRAGTPAGLAFRNGHLYICDTDINAVHDWDLATGKAGCIGLDGDVVLAKPVDVAVDAAGTVYVADTGRGEVVSFDAAGRELGRFRPPDRGDYRPVSVAVTGSRLYVADIAAHRVDLFSTDSSLFLTSFGGVGSNAGRFYFPMGVATSANGSIFISDMMNGRVQIFDSSYDPVLTFGRPGNRYGNLGKPRHLAVAADGVIFVADAEFSHVQLFDERGRLLMLLGGPDDKPGGTPMPVGVAIAPTLPEPIAALVPDDFRADYYLFVATTLGGKRIHLFAIGSPAG